MYTILYLWKIDHLGAEVSYCTLLAAVRALWWQKNSANKWRTMGKIHRINDKTVYFYRIPSSKRFEAKCRCLWLKATDLTDETCNDY